MGQTINGSIMSVITEDFKKRVKHPEMIGKVRLTVNKLAKCTSLEPYIGKKVWYISDGGFKKGGMTRFVYDINTWSGLLQDTFFADSNYFNFPPLYYLMKKYKDCDMVDLMSLCDGYNKEIKQLRKKVKHQENVINRISRVTIQCINWIKNGGDISKELDKILGVVNKNNTKI